MHPEWGNSDWAVPLVTGAWARAERAVAAPVRQGPDIMGDQTEVVRRLYRAFAEGDIAGLKAGFSDDVV